MLTTGAILVEMALQATVVELLPSAAYRLVLENQQIVMAHAAGGGEEFCAVAAADRVRGGAFAAMIRPGAGS